SNAAARRSPADVQGDGPVPFIPSRPPVRCGRRPVSSPAPARLSAVGLLLALTLILSGVGPSRGQGQVPDGAPRPAATPRRVPESLNFANGLFRERRYEMAAKEYERFLREGQPSSVDAAEARFGLANARLFQGEYEKARGQFEEFLRRAPDNPGAGTAWYRVG